MAIIFVSSISQKGNIGAANTISHKLCQHIYLIVSIYLWVLRHTAQRADQIEDICQVRGRAVHYLKRIRNQIVQHACAQGMLCSTIVVCVGKCALYDVVWCQRGAQRR